MSVLQKVIESTFFSLLSVITCRRSSTLSAAASVISTSSMRDFGFILVIAPSMTRSNSLAGSSSSGLTILTGISLMNIFTRSLALRTNKTHKYWGIKAPSNIFKKLIDKACLYNNTTIKSQKKSLKPS
ncbi:hypothetical protein MARINOS108_11257 [Marinoscillum sp. 108]|nr:hypothetical protein MARINOS108_11257 [Marinoscillum sp. 108]